MRKFSLLAWSGVVGLAGCGDDAPGEAATMGSGIGSVSQTGGEETGDPSSEGSGDAGGECSEDGECGNGEICQAGSCVAGCRDDSTCGGQTCCDGACVDSSSDAAHCGGCGDACDADMTCADGQCRLLECEAGRNDCNGDPSDGCETNGECTCVPGEMQACYTAEPATLDVGECHGGMQVCNDFGTAWGPCEGEVIPDVEVCGNGLDDNCNGMADEDLDADGDGWTVCGGDCCDEAGAICSNPNLVNPGAFEVDGNMVDDDCDGVADNPLAACDAALATNSGDALDYVRAIDLCQFTEETPATPEEATWGVISAALTRADGAGATHANARSIRNGFGSMITTQFGNALAVLSTGHAADNHDDTNPNYAAFQEGQNIGGTSALPADWLTANGGTVPNAPGCPGPDDNQAYNPVMLTVRVRAPTNANSFSVQMYFFSAEYPEWVCTPYNDFFVTLVDSADPANPADGNIAIYDDGANTWPVGVNLVSAAAGLFTQCVNGTIAHCGAGGTYNGCTGIGELTGTGFDVNFPGPLFSCVPTARTGGGTGWLTMSGNVEPGETFEIRFAIWDTSDPLYDSLVLLDNWQWNVDASQPGVRPS